MKILQSHVDQLHWFKVRHIPALESTAWWWKPTIDKLTGDESESYGKMIDSTKPWAIKFEHPK